MSWNHLCPSCPTWCCRSPSPCEWQRKGKLVISGQSLQMSKTGTALARNSLPMPFPALHTRGCVLKMLGFFSAVQGAPRETTPNALSDSTEEPSTLLC